MYCSHCGAANAPGLTQCGACGAALLVPGGRPPGLPVPRPYVPTYLTQAILVTVFCAPHFIGIVAIVYASQVEGKLAAGDIAGAMESSRTARIWCWVGLWVMVGFFVLVLALVIFFFLFAAVAAQTSQ